jgi:hypothetical protein
MKNDTTETNQDIPSSIDWLDDEATQDVIDEIVAKEADVVLDAEDGVIEIQTEMQRQKESFLKRCFHKLTYWASLSAFRWTFFAVTSIVVMIVILVPGSRYAALNLFGVQTAIEARIIDDSTQQPLKNVTLRVGDRFAKSDGQGIVSLQGLHLGSTEVIIEKQAFATERRQVTLEWGSNKQGTISLRAVGAQYTFDIKEFLGGAPVQGAEVTNGEGSATANAEGVAIIVLDSTAVSEQESLEFKVTMAGFRSEQISISTSAHEKQAVVLVPSKKHVFVSRRTGKMDLYAVDIDGKNEKLLVPATGLERDDIVLEPSPLSSAVVLVSTREDVRDQYGYLESTLTLVDSDSGATTKIDQSERIQLVGWTRDERLIYVKVASGTSAGNPNRQKMMSISMRDLNDKKELASSNGFNDVLLAQNFVYYAPSNISSNSFYSGVFRISGDGSNKQKVYDKDTYSIVRTAYNAVAVNSQGSWQNYRLGEAAPSGVTNQPASLKGAFYLDDLSGAKSLWMDERDGKTLMLLYDPTSQKDQTLLTDTSMTGKAYWFDMNRIIYRTQNGKITTDNVIDIRTNTAQKITDVQSVSLGGGWYYYN